MVERYSVDDFELNRGEKKKKKKSKFMVKRENTLNSLKEVEFFLTNWKKAINGVRLYKILR